MSLQGALRELVAHQQKVAGLVQTLLEIGEGGAPPQQIEARVVNRELTAKGTQRKRKPATRNYPAWCDNPECPNRHNKRQSGATKFMAISRRQHFCTPKCKTTVFDAKRLGRRKSRAIRRAKRGLKVHGNTKLVTKNGHPPRLRNGAQAISPRLRINSNGNRTYDIPAAELPRRRAQCPICKDGFIASGRAINCGECIRNKMRSNAVFARAKRYGHSKEKIELQIREIWADTPVPALYTAHFTAAPSTGLTDA